MDMLDKMLSQYGFGVVMALIMVFFLWNILKWTKTQIERTIAAAEKREEVSMTMWAAHRKALEDHTECSKAFHSEVSKAHEFQRAEHAEQLKALEKVIDRIDTMPRMAKMGGAHV